ncbi:hypothetical protein ACS0TY_026509 [Phlomoides rotata]
MAARRPGLIALFDVDGTLTAPRKAHTTHTELRDLKPLPVTALGNGIYEALYNFTHFNPI